MTSILNELRLILAHKLLDWIVTLAPKDMQEGRDLVNMAASLPVRKPTPKFPTRER